MSTRRQLKAAEAIREVVAQAILTELRDPRVKDVTVIGVKVSPDMREAKVAVSVMGDEKQQTLTLRGLQNSAGFLQSKIAGRIETRYTPRLQFTLDKGQENAMVVGELLAKIRREQQPESDDSDSPDAVSESSTLASAEDDSVGPTKQADGDQQSDSSSGRAEEFPTS